VPASTKSLKLGSNESIMISYQMLAVNQKWWNNFKL